MAENCKNCRWNYQSYHCMDCYSYDGNLEELFQPVLSILLNKNKKQKEQKVFNNFYSFKDLILF